MALKDFLVIVLAVFVILAAVKVFNLQVTIPYYHEPQLQETVVNTAPGSVAQSAGASRAGVSFPQLPDLANFAGKIVAFNNQTAFLLRDYVAPFCGDTICDVGETCTACNDCACNTLQVCSAESVCQLKEYCGDSVCTALENATSSCCLDCGCGEGTVCNEKTHTCIGQVRLSESQLNVSISAALSLPDFANYTLYGVFDDYYEHKAVNVVVLRCSGNPDFDCEGYVYIDANGEIIGTGHTN